MLNVGQSNQTLKHTAKLKVFHYRAFFTKVRAVKTWSIVSYRKRNCSPKSGLLELSLNFTLGAYKLYMG